MAFEETTTDALAKVGDEVTALLAEALETHQKLVDYYKVIDPRIALALSNQFRAINGLGLGLVKALHVMADHLASEARLRELDEDDPARD